MRLDIEKLGLAKVAGEPVPVVETGFEADDCEVLVTVGCLGTEETDLPLTHINIEDQTATEDSIFFDSNENSLRIQAVGNDQQRILIAALEYITAVLKKSTGWDRSDWYLEDDLQTEEPK